MKTQILEGTTENIEIAARIIKEGGLVVFPTETVYGLGANALDEKAVVKVYEAKGRPSDNPMIVHIAKAEDLKLLTSEITPAIKILMDEIWPGPLTMIVKKLDNMPMVTTGGLDTVAVRMPDDKITLELIEKAGCPLVGPSANLSGKPSPTRVQHVIEDLDGRVDAILMGGDCRVGIESTVVDMTGEIPVILRPGILTAQVLENILGSKVKYDEYLYARPEASVDFSVEKQNPLSAGFSEEFKPKSPGMKYKHYAPKAEMVIYSGEGQAVKKSIEEAETLAERAGRKVGVILFGENDFEEAAHDFFAKLRDFDSQEVDLILAGALSDENQVGFAVMNRMMKSAGYNIVEV